MTKKSFFVILGLSIVATIGIPFVGFITNTYSVYSGWPFQYTGFSFFGGSGTNYTNFSLNIVFWFIIIWLIWKFLFKIFKR